jgi:2-aminomuconate deaminase
MSGINSAKAPKPVGLYPHARRAGDFIFLSGVGPREAGTDAIPKGIEKQVLSVFDNVRNILEEAGASWNDLIDVTVFLTDMKNDFPIYNRLWAEHFKDNRPCRTTVEVTALPTPISIELKCIAYVPEAKS